MCRSLWTRSAIALCAIIIILAQLSRPALAQPAANNSLSLSSTDTQRFVAVHGRRSVIMGYPQTGLEVWAYPVQILSNLEIGFRPEDSTTEVPGSLLLRRIIEEPDSVTRIYAGPDYVIREKLFVPLDRPAAVLTYEVSSARPVSIILHCTPVLDLMWPAAIGGQSISWNPAAHGYLLEEATHTWKAVIASPDVTTHDDTVNSTLRPENTVSFAIQPRIVNKDDLTSPSTASVYISLLDPPEDAVAAIKTLASSMPQLESTARKHYADLANQSLSIVTPDDDINAAIAWSEIALDQAWVCNPSLGCGEVAGYGPSRDARRPQYDWFFAGDGLVAVNALIASGQYTRARDELLFIEKYQDKQTGMIWHELSQSAGQIDWSKYPYMFVHVDITFDYINAVANYVDTTGDVAFANDHWPSIESAYRYCDSLLGSDNLPHIPAGKEGGDEQHRPAQDLGLPVSWVEATSSFAQLARSTGHDQLADDALHANQLARPAIATHFWDAKKEFWIDGFTPEGGPIFTRRSGPTAAIEQNIFTADQNDDFLNQLASPAFQSDWGTRSVATDSSIYDPWSYAAGSVSALHSSEVASLFWNQHRPDIAWPLWRSITAWNTLDSLEHLHEVLAGNYYRPQTESVPEQTWSSAGLLTSAIHGLLGFDLDGLHNSIIFQPHLPPEWDRVSIANLRLPHSTLSLVLSQSIDRIDLSIDDDGSPTMLLFQPQIPLGATITSAECNGIPIPAAVKRSHDDEHANLSLNVQSGSSHCRINLNGGVGIIAPPSSPKVGDESRTLKITKTTFDSDKLVIDVAIRPNVINTLRIRTPWHIVSVQGAKLTALPNNMYEVHIDQPPNRDAHYVDWAVIIDFTSP